MNSTGARLYRVAACMYCCRGLRFARHIRICLDVACLCLHSKAQLQSCITHIVCVTCVMYHTLPMLHSIMYQF